MQTHFKEHINLYSVSTVEEFCQTENFLLYLTQTLYMYVALFSNFFPPMPPHALVDFVVLPPGHGRSVTD